MAPRGARIPVLTAAEGAGWESSLVVDLERSDAAVTVVRRCVDVVDLLAVAGSGQARAALVASGLRRLDADAVDRLVAAEITVVAVVPRGDVEAESRMRALGIEHTVADDAASDVVASVVEQAVRTPGTSSRPSRTFADPVAPTGAVLPPSGVPSPVEAPARRGSVIAVWGPTGGPGRTTVAVTLADELARLGAAALLVDADVYGGVIAAVLGLLDESPGLAAACRQASAARMSPETLAGLCWQLGPMLRVLTGIPRADRWPELRPAGLESVLAAARGLADFTVVDCGFNLETDEELSFDTLAPRRNGATLTVLDTADLVLVVGAADPVGVQRVVRGLTELRDAEVAAPLWVILNKVRGTVVPGNPAAELSAALDRFAGRAPAALLPYDRPALDSALATGKTLGEQHPDSPLRRAIGELAAAVAGVPQPRRGRRRR